MKNIIIRMDDFGSAKASNKAILEIVNGTKTAKNVSCMAIGKDMEQGAEALKQVPGICVGLHAVLNSEWDEIKWKPAAMKKPICLQISGFQMESCSMKENLNIVC